MNRHNPSPEEIALKAQKIREENLARKRASDKRIKNSPKRLGIRTCNMGCPRRYLSDDQ